MFLLLLHVLCGVTPVSAQQLIVDIGTPLSLGQITGNIVNFLAASIGFLTVALFMVGALMLTASGFHEEWRNKGKDLMINSLIAMVIVLGAYAILRTVAFFILA